MNDWFAQIALRIARATKSKKKNNNHTSNRHLMQYLYYICVVVLLSGQCRPQWKMHSRSCVQSSQAWRQKLPLPSNEVSHDVCLLASKSRSCVELRCAILHNISLWPIKPWFATVYYSCDNPPTAPYSGESSLDLRYPPHVLSKHQHNCAIPWKNVDAIGIAIPYRGGRNVGPLRQFSISQSGASGIDLLAPSTGWMLY